MISVQECLLIIDEVQDCKKSGRILAGKLKQFQAVEVASLLQVLVDEYDMEEVITEILYKLDAMPINYFETILEYSEQLAELYNGE